VLNRPTLRAIMETGIFQRFIELNRSNGPGTIVSIKDQDGKEIVSKVSVT